MADNIIKEFLVGLGFKIDGQEAFTASLDLAQAKAVALGEAMYDTAKAVAEAITNMASGFDSLYWQTQRLGSSAGDIKAYGYAISQLGGSATGAQSALENIAEFMKSYPGAGGWLTGLGVNSKDIGNAEAVARDLAAVFKRMPYYQAKQYANVLGIDPLQLQAMGRDTGKFEQQYKDFAKNIGIDLDDVAGKSNSFMTQLREMKAEAGLLFDYAMFKGLEQALPLLKQFAAWVKDMASGKQLSGIAGQFQGLVKDIGDLITALGKLAHTSYMGEFGSMMVRALDDVIKFAGHFVNMITAILNRDWAAAKREMNAPIDDLKDHPDASAAASSSSPTPSAPGGPNTSPSGSAPRNNPGNLRVPGQHAFQQFTSMQAGAQAMASQLQRYGKRGWDSLNSIISHYAPAKDHNNTAAYIAYVAKRLGVNSGAHLNLNDQGTLSNLMSAMIHVEQGRDLYSPAQLKTILGTRAGGGVSIAQSTTIHVHGGDRHVANDIAAQQDGVNQRLVANASVFAY